MEEYKNVFENYEISNFGNLRKKLITGEYKNIKGSILKTGGGYKYLQIKREGKRINKLFHHLVAQAFLGNRPEKLVIDHIDRNPLNNNLINLRYITQKKNTHNCEKYKNEIEEEDPIKRKKLVSILYRQKNIEKLKEKKKEYYNNNKEKILEQAKNNKVIVKCSQCNLERGLKLII
jgi:flagellar motility protein MotE (MotC chaperone)